MVKEWLLPENAANAKAAPGGGLAFQRSNHSVLWLLRVRHLPVAAFVHELVELGLVLCKAKAVQEFPELTLLFLEPAQRIGPVLVEGAVAARWRVVPATAPWTPAHP